MLDRSRFMGEKLAALTDAQGKSLGSGGSRGLETKRDGPDGDTFPHHLTPGCENVSSQDGTCAAPWQKSFEDLPVQPVNGSSMAFMLK
jgi:hypothetical protein